MSTTLLFPLLIVLLVGFMFFGTRKQKRAQQAQQNMQSSLSFGDRVMTTSGLYATVVSVSDDTIDLEIADGVVTSWLRAAVREKVEESITTEPVEDDVDEYDESEIESDEVAETHDTTLGATPAHEPTVIAEASTTQDAELAPSLEQSKKSS
jgi:preprotein translocase subunit YajC